MIIIIVNIKINIENLDLAQEQDQKKDLVRLEENENIIEDLPQIVQIIQTEMK